MAKFRILERHERTEDDEGQPTRELVWIDRGEVTAGNRYQARYAFADRSGKEEITLVAVSAADWVEDTMRTEQRKVIVSSKPPKRRNKPKQKAEAGSA
jgi:hypothetical protein